MFAPVVCMFALFGTTFSLFPVSLPANFYFAISAPNLTERTARVQFSGVMTAVVLSVL